LLLRSVQIWVFNRSSPYRDSIPFVVVCRFRAPLHLILVSVLYITLLQLIYIFDKFLR
jgi:hypothetical protein